MVSRPRPEAPRQLLHLAAAHREGDSVGTDLPVDVRDEVQANAVVGPASFGRPAPGASFQIIVRYLPRDTSGVDALIIVPDSRASFGIPMVGSAVMPATLDAAVEAGLELGGG